jgi:hypothetical protein
MIDLTLYITFLYEKKYTQDACVIDSDLPEHVSLSYLS